MVSIESAHGRSRTRSGSILYHKLGKYDPVVDTVQFSFSSTDLRFVKSTGDSDRDGDQSSWVYADEDVSDSDNSTTSEKEVDNKSDRRHGREGMVSKTIRKRKSARKGHTSITNKFEVKAEVTTAETDGETNKMRYRSNSNRAETTTSNTWAEEVLMVIKIR